MIHAVPRWFRAGACLAIGITTACAGSGLAHDAQAQPAIIDLGRLPGGSPAAWATAAGISADGRVIVGTDDGRAFRWDGALHEIAGARNASAANADGSVIVGTMTSPEHAFRWTEAGGLQDLGTLPGTTASAASGVSADGAIVVGRATTAQGSVPWIWDAIGGMRSLDAFDGATSGRANAISRDGAVVVGASGNHTFRWTVQGGLQDLSWAVARSAKTPSTRAGACRGWGLSARSSSTDSTSAAERRRCTRGAARARFARATRHEARRAITADRTHSRRSCRACARSRPCRTHRRRRA